MKISLPTVSCWAVFARSHCATYSSLAPLAKRVKQAAELAIPLVALMKGETSPSFWKTECMVVGIADRSVGVRRRRGPDECAAQVILRLLRQPSFQKVASRQFVKTRFPIVKLVPELDARISKTFCFLAPPYRVPPLRGCEWLEMAESSRPHMAQCSARFLLNALPTTARLHVDPRGCIYGCDGAQDTLSHYYECPIVNRAMFRAGLVKPSLLTHACAYSIYCAGSRLGSGFDLGEAVRAALRLHS